MSQVSSFDIVTILVIIDGVLIGSRIYFTLIKLVTTLNKSLSFLVVVTQDVGGSTDLRWPSGSVIIQ
jgi:hypothetical protein